MSQTTSVASTTSRPAGLVPGLVPGLAGDVLACGMHPNRNAGRALSPRMGAVQSALERKHRRMPFRCMYGHRSAWRRSLREQSVDMPHSSRNCCVMPVAAPSLCMICRYQWPVCQTGSKTRSYLSEDWRLTLGRRVPVQTCCHICVSFSTFAALTTLEKDAKVRHRHRDGQSWKKMQKSSTGTDKARQR